MAFLKVAMFMVVGAHAHVRDASCFQEPILD